MPQLDIQKVSVSYPNGYIALQSVDLQIEKGEFIVLVGPSGCGKTTLLRAISGLEKITTGEIWIAGQRVDESSPGSRDVAMVFQDYALYPHMTVRQNLEFGLKMRGETKQEARSRAEEASQMLDIKNLLERRPQELSGGQRQRVAIGRAIVRNPQVFLFDEPLSNLDAQLRSQTRIELAAMHRRLKSTSVYVTHDQVEAMTLADRIVVLNQGRVQQIGAPLELYRKPANLFVAAFIGSPTMNFLEGELRFEGKRKLFGSLDLTSAWTPRDAGPWVLGFRPEALQVCVSSQLSGELFGEQSDFPRLRIRITGLEPHGYETHYFGKTLFQEKKGESASIIFRESESGGLAPFKLDQELTLSIDPHEMHWFEARGAGRRIEAEVPPSMRSSA